MLQLPEKLRTDLNARFKFTQVITKEDTALFLPFEGERFLVCVPPPNRAGLNNALIKKALVCKAPLVVILTGCDTSTDWFHMLWNHFKANPNRVDIEFFNGRIRWEEDGVKSRFKNRVPGMLAIFNGQSDNH